MRRPPMQHDLSGRDQSARRARASAARASARSAIGGAQRVAAWSCLAAMALMPACRPSPAPGAAGPLLVFAAIPPQAYFIERIAGPHARVQYLVGAGQSPHNYEPTPRQMAQLAQARLYFTLGLGFEQRVVAHIRSSRAPAEIVDTRAGVPMLTMIDHVCEPGEHSHDHTHDAGAPDPHIWLDPKRVHIQARTICAALTRADPEHQHDFSANLAAFERDLDALDAEITALLEPLRGRTLIVFHPAYGYFADSYGLRQLAIEIAGKEPSPRELTQIVQQVRDQGAKALFYQPQYARTTIDVVAREIGAVAVPLDEFSHDYLNNLRAMTHSIRDALAGTPSP